MAAFIARGRSSGITTYRYSLNIVNDSLIEIVNYVSTYHCESC